VSQAAPYNPGVARKRTSPADEALERAEGRPSRRIWFHIEEVELKWLPVSETAFLLWVLAFLVLVWLAVALVLFFL
jgi:hypothetical protein